MSSRRTAKIPRRPDHHDCTVENVDENVNSVATESNANSSMELTYDVLSIIFKHLNAKDLRNAARVCRRWSEVANIEKRVRSSFPLILSERLAYSWDDLSPGKPFIDNMRVKPILSTIFTRHFFWGTLAMRQRKVDCPCRTLPSECTHITVKNHGIIEDQYELDCLGRTALMLLPEDEDVSIDTIFHPYCDRPNLWPFPKDLPVTESDSKKLEKFSAITNRVKCFIVLSMNAFENSLPLLKFMPRGKTLTGCAAEHLWLCKKSKNENFCSKPLAWMAILMSGRGLNTWSAVLEAECHTEEKIEAKLTKLRKLVQLKTNCICFVFACNRRGENVYREPEVELASFKKLFPEVPLVGCFGDTAFGNCSIDDIDDRNHEFATVFTIVTYGHS